jgi:4'-phosphopantetheinyl transferase
VEGRRNEHLVARTLCRQVLGELLDVPPRELRFVTEERGRPLLHPDYAAPLTFSISHTDGLVTLAVCHDAEVGSDAENCDRATDTDSLMERVHCSEERAYIRRAGEEAERTRRFLHCWTLKEAVLKSTGMGIAVRLERFGYDVSGGRLSWGPPVSAVRESAASSDAPDAFSDALMAGFHAELIEPTETHIVATAWPIDVGAEVRYFWAHAPSYEPERLVAEVILATRT